MSYPAVFVAGSVALALVPTVWRQPGWKAKALYVVFGLVMFASFFGNYWLAGVGQFQSIGGTECIWRDAFPSRQPLALVYLLVHNSSGNMFAYPAGDQNGLSAVSFVLSLIGVACLARRRAWVLLVLLLGPFALNFVAAAMQRYPYGGSARVAQHLVPSICLLMGVGLAAVGDRLCRSRPAWAPAALAMLVLFGAAGILRDWFRPFKTEGDLGVRQVVAGLMAQARPEDQIVVMDPGRLAKPTLEWYLRLQGSRISWDAMVQWDRLQAGAGRLWMLYFQPDPARLPRYQAAGLEGEGLPRLTLVDHLIMTYRPGFLIHLEAFEWALQEDGDVSRVADIPGQ